MWTPLIDKSDCRSLCMCLTTLDVWVASTHRMKNTSSTVYLVLFCFPHLAPTKPCVPATDGSAKTFLSFFFFFFFGLVVCILLIQSCAVWLIDWLKHKVHPSQTLEFDVCMFSQASSTYYAWIQLKLLFFCILLYIALKYICYTWCLYVEKKTTYSLGWIHRHGLAQSCLFSRIHDALK